MWRRPLKQHVRAWALAFLTAAVILGLIPVVVHGFNLDRLAADLFGFVAGACAYFAGNFVYRVVMGYP